MVSANCCISPLPPASHGRTNARSAPCRMVPPLYLSQSPLNSPSSSPSPSPSPYRCRTLYSRRSRALPTDTLLTTMSAENIKNCKYTAPRSCTHLPAIPNALLPFILPFPNHALDHSHPFLSLFRHLSLPRVPRAGGRRPEAAHAPLPARGGRRTDGFVLRSSHEHARAGRQPRFGHGKRGRDQTIHVRAAQQPPRRPGAFP